MNHSFESLIVAWFNAGIIKFGEFKLKSGATSSIYLNLRQLIAFPKLFKSTMEYLGRYTMDYNIGTRDNIFCGIPYTGLFLVTSLSAFWESPIMYCRKERKSYGTKQQIEGNVPTNGNKVVLIDDVLTSGSSILETDQVLTESLGKQPQYDSVWVLVDRRPDHLVGTDLLIGKQSVPVHSLCNLKDIYTVLGQAKKIPANIPNPYCLSRIERLKSSQNEMTKRLVNLMERKKTRLILSADLKYLNEINALVKDVGHLICGLKLHSDIIEGFNFIEMCRLKKQWQRQYGDDMFFLIEDRKFADIGSTVKAQMQGSHQIHEWADLVTVHSLFGDGALEAIDQLNQEHSENPTNVLFLAEGSPDGNLITPDYVQKTVDMAQKWRHLITGFISQNPVAGDDFLYLTPGVNLVEQKDNLKQKYRTPQQVLASGCDIIIVGRGIIKAENPRKTAEDYRLATQEKGI